MKLFNRKDSLGPDAPGTADASPGGGTVPLVSDGANIAVPLTMSQSLKGEVHRRLLENMDLAQARRMPRDELQRECLRRIDAILSDMRTPLSAPEKQRLLREVMDEVFGLGPLEELMRDPAVTDILVNGAFQIYVERMGRLEEATQSFRDDGHLLQVIQRIAARVGRRIDESAPMLDARLPDGSRVNAIIPPLALDGPTMSVRRFGAKPFDMVKLIEVGAVMPEMDLSRSVRSGAAQHRHLRWHRLG